LNSVQESFSFLLKKRIVWICACLALATAIVPFVRAFFRVEVDYNEGWNVYNASIVADYHLLYREKYAWTTVNYPMLSFFIQAQLHRLTHDYLFTARAVSVLSLTCCSVLVGAIVRSLSGSWQASTLAGFYCLALFCTDADIYVGMDDPQMFAQVFFLAGLLVYLWRRESLLAIACAALLFVVGGCIKHNPIDFPLAVLLELALISLRRALWFSGWGLFFCQCRGGTQCSLWRAAFPEPVAGAQRLFGRQGIRSARERLWAPAASTLCCAVYGVCGA